MTLLQIGINLLLAVVAYALANFVLAQLGIGGVVAFVIAALVAVGVFFANFAARIRA